jgi:hypothetical protein
VAPVIFELEDGIQENVTSLEMFDVSEILVGAPEQID